MDAMDQAADRSHTPLHYWLVPDHQSCQATPSATTPWARQYWLVVLMYIHG
ncbi:hypothetical protein SNOG_00773 [Parastagonospora nodorum SN15]|uniref:Uncharacterized protein n=1 Tax=Phaeosphaeria nodorum (strain SN15 / ATCC MYA-4574 / FGSC 10173) TaxID=321614 RepID=Q0V5E1_PHANO|nr:hypothetical protein SNOG_00773 [Parastagonospora nodorum SN15]EAT92268.1 hypothetical protein SNOG_00773 [Parastagonospora nodorum SN15]